MDGVGVSTTEASILLVFGRNEALFRVSTAKVQTRYPSSTDVTPDLLSNTAHAALHEATHLQTAPLVDKVATAAKRVDPYRRPAPQRGARPGTITEWEGNAMDEFATADAAQGGPVPDKLRALFNDPDQVRVQKLPSEIPGLDSKAVHFAAGARTMPHRHEKGQHIIVTAGIGVVADEKVVQVVRPGDVISNPPGGWHWHGGTPTSAMSHVTVEDPGLDLDVERRDWDDVYNDNLGT